MKIGVIGAGGIGGAFALHAARAGYEVIVSNSRGPESLKEFIRSAEGNISAVDTETATKADIVFLGIKWPLLEQIAGLKSSWEGTIIIDPTNPILPGFIIADLGGKTSSEVVSQVFKGARLVKAFNTMSAAELEASPATMGGRRVMFFSGDDSGAKEVIAKIIDNIGFFGIDLGNLAHGGRLQQFPGGSLAGQNLVKI